MTKLKALRRIDSYIEEQPAFAQPICRKLREIIHRADPEIMEDWEWGPSFCKRGKVCGFGVFNMHVSLAFFKGALMKDAKNILLHAGSNRNNRIMQFSSENDINETVLIEYIREAVMINEMKQRTPAPTKVLDVPHDLQTALSEDRQAQANFDNLAYSDRKEYVDWVESARRDETRTARISEVVKRTALNQKLNDQA